jgi:hypothetical protein
VRAARRISPVFFFQEETGTRYQFVPYRNIGMQDLMAARIDLMICGTEFAAGSICVNRRPA